MSYLGSKLTILVFEMVGSAVGRLSTEYGVLQIRFKDYIRIEMEAHSISDLIRTSFYRSSRAISEMLLPLTTSTCLRHRMKGILYQYAYTSNPL